MAKKEKAPKEYRGIIDEIREQQRKLKDMTWKERWQYFWGYYKYQVLAVAFIAFFVITLAHNIITAKDYCFYGMMLNSSMLDQEKMEAAFAEYAGLDLEEYDCYIDTQSTLSYVNPSDYELATSQRIIALTQTKDLDVSVFTFEVFYNYSFNQLFMDLRDVLTEEELAKYEGKIYYVDYAKIRQAEESDDYSSSYSMAGASESVIAAEIEAYKDPSTMEEPIPVGIYLDDSPFAEKSGSYLGSTPIYGIAVTTQRVDTAKLYLDFLFDEEIDFAGMKSETY